MRILAIDMGTGTQDILLFDSDGPVENCVKMVMPSATEIAARRIRRATLERRPVLLTGVTMGGGPCHWALEAHIKAGESAFATQEAAKTFDDDLAVVAGMGVAVVSEDEAAKLRGVERIEMRDLDLNAIRRALAAFEVPSDFDGLAVGCLDHGAAPPGFSDRLFRFNHLKQVVETRNDLTAFAMLPDELPEYLTRARSMIASIDIEVPTVFLDTGPAAALGALQDPRVAEHDEQVVVNLGNMHALGFFLSGPHIHALYEHHTGLLDSTQIETMTERLVDGSLTHEEVFAGHGHGVYYADARHGRSPFVAVTGPQRGKLRGSRLQPYFAAPHGDMMISGCFGLVQAFGERYPAAREPIATALGTRS
ncbi:MAG TPA: DUF1786 family protein [Dehalococcoidia bacterium]|nr:DUF1786 family protein [Dehalococcoidia bacterium]